MIFAWISKHLEGSDNSRIYGKCLFADNKGIWRL